MLAAIVLACSVSAWDPNAILENTPVYSSNGRFCAIVRWIDDLPDFHHRVAGEPREYDENAPVRTTVTTALYEGQNLLMTVPIDVAAIHNVLVSDAGRYLVAVRSPNSGECYPDPTITSALLTIYRSNGSRVRSLTLGDLVSDDYDLWRLRNAEPIAFALRAESDTREVAVVRIVGQEFSVDLATGELLDPKRQLVPHPRAVVAEESANVLSQARFAPLPEVPIVALKARISGTVRVRMVVSEDGEVLSTSSSPLPFGLDQAAADAARRWRFVPKYRDGRRVPFTCEIVFHFLYS